MRSRWKFRWRETSALQRAAARPCGRVGSFAGAKLLRCKERLRDLAVALEVSLARNFCAAKSGCATLRSRWKFRWRETSALQRAAARPCGCVGSFAGAKLLRCKERLRDLAVALEVSLARNFCVAGVWSCVPSRAPGSGRAQPVVSERPLCLRSRKSCLVLSGWGPPRWRGSGTRGLDGRFGARDLAGTMILNLSIMRHRGRR